MNNPFGTGNSGKKRTPFYPNDSILESLRDLGSGIGQSVTKDVAGKVANDAFSSIVGKPTNTGEIPMNRPVELPKEHAHPQRSQHHESEHQHKAQAEQAKVAQQLEAVRAELKSLSASLKQFNAEIDKAINEAPIDPGTYHINYYERLRTLIKSLRQQVDDSRTWLSLTSGRKKQKNYWGLYKKHGTQFGLSSERTAATQSG